MQQYTFSQIGTFHTNHNEDFLISHPLGKNQSLIAVMDGCTMGTDSHFAATLIGKLLRKFAKEYYYQSFTERIEKSLGQLLRMLLEQLFTSLKALKNQLSLEQEELLSTLIIGIIDQEIQQAQLLTIGDGVVYCNGQLTEYDQANNPDYLGYHLARNFDTWYAQQTQGLSLDNIQDLSISTDGIFTFRAYDTKRYEQVTEKEIINFLFADETYHKQKNMLYKKMRIIEEKWGLKPTDDLSVIRLINFE